MMAAPRRDEQIATLQRELEAAGHGCQREVPFPSTFSPFQQWNWIGGFLGKLSAFTLLQKGQPIDIWRMI